MTELLRITSAIMNPWSLAAYAVAAIVYILLKRRGKVPVMAWVSILLLVVVPTGASVYVEVARKRSEDTSIYRLRVTVLNPQHVPVEDAKVWSSIGGEPKKVAGGWSFDIPTANRPAEGRLTIFASVPAAFLSGKQELVLGNCSAPR